MDFIYFFPSTDTDEYQMYNQDLTEVVQTFKLHLK